MKRFFAKFGRLSFGDWLLLAEVVPLLAWARLSIGLLPFRVIARRLGAVSVEDGVWEALPSDGRARRIGALVRGASRHLPWECKCLVQAMASRSMLGRRGIPCVVFIGVATDAEKGFAAHAWVRSGAVYVSGGRARGGFRVLARFAADGRDAAS